MGRTCSTNRRHVYKMLVGNANERDNVGDSDVDGRTSKWPFEK
jgi:hypothetical protein